MDGHRIDGDRFAGIEQFADGWSIFGFEGDLADSVVWTGAGGFCVEKDEHFEVTTLLQLVC